MSPELLEVSLIKGDVFRLFGQGEEDHLNNSEKCIAEGDDQEPFYIRIGNT